MTTEFNTSVLLAYDYAISGAAVDMVYQDGQTVRGYIQQVTEDFVPYAGQEKETVWTAENSLFSIYLCFCPLLIVVSWIGINDVRLDRVVHVSMAQLFDMAEVLYLNGARKFIYITVPPLERTPAGMPPLGPLFPLHSGLSTLY